MGRAVCRCSFVPHTSSLGGTRLDPHNGLLLSPAYDAAFDAGIISFAETGEAILSAELTPQRVERLGVSPAARIDGLHEKHRGYLDHHRKHVFAGGQP